MTLALTMIGAGEYTSLESGETHRYMRFRAANGQEVNLECSEEQLRSLLTFASRQVEAAPAARADTPPVRPSSPPRQADAGDPNILDDEDDNKVVALRGVSPFAGREDNDL